MLVRLFYFAATVYTILAFTATYFASLYKPTDVVIEKLLVSMIILPIAFVLHLSARWIRYGRITKSKPRYRFNHSTGKAEISG